MKDEKVIYDICLFGGNIVKEIYVSLKKSSHVNYIPWISPVSLASNKCDNTVDNVKNISKNIAIEFEKDFLKYVSNSHVIILDLETLRYPHIIYKDTKFTDTGDFRQTSFYSHFLKDFSYNKNIFLDKTLVLDSVEKFAGILLQRFKPKNIILIRHGRAVYSHVKNHIISNQGINEYNSLISSYEQRFIDCTRCIVIDVWKKYFSDYGKIPVLYEESFYTDILKKINAVLKNDKESIMQDKADFAISLRRYIYYYDFANLRKFVEVFLDKSIPFEYIISMLGKEFIEKYFTEIVELHDITQGYSDNDKILDRVAEVGEKELYSGFAAVCAIISKRYYICDNYSVIFRYHFQVLEIAKKQMNTFYSERNIDLVDINQQNIEMLFKCMIKNNTDRLPQELISYTYRIPVDIWGSCISREVFNVNIDDVYVNKYAFRVSLLNAGLKPIKVDESVYNIDNFRGNEWMQRCTLIEWKRIIKEYMDLSAAKWLVVDVSTILYPTYSYCNQDFSMAFELKGTPFWRLLEKDIKLVDYTKAEYTDDFFINRMKAAVEIIRQKYGSNVILIDTMWSKEVAGTDRKIREWDWINDFERYRIERRNHISILCEDYLQRELDCYRITYTRQFFADDFFPGGETMQLHYEEAFYHEANNTIVSIIKTKPDKRVYDTYRIKTRIRRIVDLNRCHENRPYLDKVFNQYELDGVLLDMPVDIVERYTDVLERFYLRGYNNVGEILQDYDFESNGCVELKQYFVNKK